MTRVDLYVSRIAEIHSLINDIYIFTVFITSDPTLKGIDRNLI